MKLKNIIWSWDLWASLIISIVAYWVLPLRVSNEFARSVYEVGISVISIVFSVYFASLAIIMSASDDEFIRFMEEDGSYSRLIASYKYSLVTLFVSLLYSVLLFGWTAALQAKTLSTQPIILFLLFCMLFFYGLLAIIGSSMDSIAYSNARIRYIRIRSEIAKAEEKQNSRAEH